jgi:hypothetical protein
LKSIHSIKFACKRILPQQHQFFAVTDLNVSPDWEINVGIGVGVTGSTDHLIVKGILGRRFNWGHHQSETPNAVK